MIATSYSDEQEAFARSVAAVVDRHGAGGTAVATDDLWRDLADVGFLAICAPGSGGTPLDLVAGMEALGTRCAPGPLVATAAAAALLVDDDRDPVVSGQRRVTFTDGCHVPWGMEADVVLALARDGAWIVTVDGMVPVPTLSGEPWCTGRAIRVRRVGEAEQPIALADLGLAAYLLGAAVQLVERAAAYAQSRVQFRRPIGDFQAVAHPLARAHAELRATQDLVRLLARAGGGASDVARVSLIRAEAVRASCRAVERAHQTFGAVGFAVETGVATVSARVRQWSVLPILARSPHADG